MAASQEEALVLDAQGITILKELLALVRPKPDKDAGADKAPPSAAEILDQIKAALEKGVDPGLVKYTALAERIRQLRDRIIQNAQDALDFLSEAGGGWHTGTKTQVTARRAHLPAQPVRPSAARQRGGPVSAPLRVRLFSMMG